MDWVKFLDGYELWPPLQSRLMLVREHLASALTLSNQMHIHITSLCAGDGRDIIGALENHPHKNIVSASLVELNTELVHRGKQAALAMKMHNRVHFSNADATLADTYIDIPAADILLMAGVLGNVRRQHERMLIENLAQLCRADAILIWTRGSINEENLQAVHRILALLDETGFSKITVDETHPAGFVVGSHRFNGKPKSLKRGSRIFSFTDYDEINT